MLPLYPKHIKLFTAMEATKNRSVFGNEICVDLTILPVRNESPGEHRFGDGEGGSIAFLSFKLLL